MSAEAVCACGGRLVSKFGEGKVWMHADPSAPRDCIALPFDHPARTSRAPTPKRDASLDTAIIRDLRLYRATRHATFRDKVTLGIEELDALLAAVDERDALKRELTAEPAEKTSTPDGRSSWPVRAPRSNAFDA